MADHLYPEAAEKLRITESWLRDNIRELPHIKYGGERGSGTVTFTDEHLDEIRRMFERRPASAPQQLTTAAGEVDEQFELRPVPSRRAS